MTNRIIAQIELVIPEVIGTDLYPNLDTPTGCVGALHNLCSRARSVTVVVGLGSGGGGGEGGDVIATETVAEGVGWERGGVVGKGATAPANDTNSAAG